MGGKAGNTGQLSVVYQKRAQRTLIAMEFEAGLAIHGAHHVHRLLAEVLQRGLHPNLCTRAWVLGVATHYCLRHSAA
jgi:hypothetical protein